MPFLLRLDCILLLPSRWSDFFKTSVIEIECHFAMSYFFLKLLEIAEQSEKRLEYKFYTTATNEYFVEFKDVLSYVM